jgi:leader peptidase (prepilin peptidase) / N-methyltransferase
MVVVLIAALFGAFIGSFLNVCIHRLPRNESVVHPPSRCYSCGTRIRWYDNLPIVGYLLLRGRCRWCAAPFSPRYLFFELVVALLSAAVVAMVFVAEPIWVASPWLAAVAPPVAVKAAATAAMCAMAFFLLVAAVIDLDHMIIPDELSKSFQIGAPFVAMLAGANLGFGGTGEHLLSTATVIGPSTLTPWRYGALVFGVVAATIVLLLISLPLARMIYSRCAPEGQRWSDDDHRGFRLGVLWFAAALVPATLVEVALLVLLPAHAGMGERGPWAAATVQLGQSLLGSCAGWMSLYLVGLIGTVAFRRNAMGFGDVKFLAPIGAMVGPVGVLYTFFIAAVLGSLVGIPLKLARSRQREIPFGPYLALAALITLVAGPAVHNALFR